MRMTSLITCVLLVVLAVAGRASGRTRGYYGGVIRGVRFGSLADQTAVSRELINQYKVSVVTVDADLRFVAYFVPVKTLDEFEARMQELEREKVVDRKNILRVTKRVVSDNDIARLRARKIYERTGNLAYILLYFPKMEEIYYWLRLVQRRYYPTCRIVEVGKSYEGRPIEALKVSVAGGSGKRTVWLDAGLHGREWSTVTASLYVIYRLLISGSKEAAAAILNEYDVYVLPVANPDGYEYTHLGKKTRMWRKNRRPIKAGCVGVDMNRNFPFMWAAPNTNSSPDPCSDVYQGPQALSEPETQQIYAYMLKLRGTLSHYLSLHSYAQSIMIPWSYKRERTSDYLDQIDVTKAARENIYNSTGRWYKIGSVGEIMYPTGGGTLDWVKTALAVRWAVAMELPPDRRGRRGFIVPIREIRFGAKDVWAAIEGILRQCRIYRNGAGRGGLVEGP